MAGLHVNGLVQCNDLFLPARIAVREGPVETSSAGVLSCLPSHALQKEGLPSPQAATCGELLEVLSCPWQAGVRESGPHPTLVSGGAGPVSLLDRRCMLLQVYGRVDC